MLSEHSLDALLAQGQRAYHTLRLEEAASAYRTVLEMAPDHYDALVGLARTLARMRQQKEAIETAQRAIEREANRPEGYATLGMLYFLTDDLAAAEEALQRAIALAPQDPEPRLTRVQVLADQHRFDEAEEALREARALIEQIEDLPLREEIEALAWHVETYLRLTQGDNLAATNAAQEVIARQEANPYAACLAYSNLGILEAKARRYEEAIAYLERAYAMNPHFHRAASALGRLLLVQRHYARAAQVLGLTAESPEASADVFYAYGLALAKSGERGKALAAYQEALRRGLGGLSRYIALWQMVWLREWGRYLIIGIALAAFLAWIVLAKPSAQTLTLFAVLVVILFLQRSLGRRGR